MLVLLAASPILWLILALTVFKLQAWKAALSALVVALGVAAIGFRTALPPAAYVTTVAEGVGLALYPICLVILAALFVYAVTVASGAMETIRKGLTAVSDDRRLVALLVVWGFGNFMEGMAGFGTAVAIPASILVGIGFKPMKAVLLCLVANTVPTAYGSVGIPLLTLARVTGLDHARLAWVTAGLEGPIVMLMPVLILLVLDGWKGLKGMLVPLLLADAAFLGPWLLVSRTLGLELPDVIGGLSVMVVLVFFATRGRALPDGRAQARAWLPFALVVGFLAAIAVLPASVKDFASPGVLILLAGFVGGRLQGLSFSALARLLGTTLVGYWRALATICAVLAMARVMSASGMIGALAAALVSLTGRYYPFVAPAVGALGGFVTGSGTSACVLFGALQSAAAERIGADPNLLAAANVMGAGIGKMICPQSIAIGAAAAGLANAEGKLLKSGFGWFLLIIILAGIICGIACR